MPAQDIQHFKDNWNQGYKPNEAAYDELFDSLLFIVDHRDEPNGVAPLDAQKKVDISYIKATGFADGKFVGVNASQELVAVDGLTGVSLYTYSPDANTGAKKIDNRFIAHTAHPTIADQYSLYSPHGIIDKTNVSYNMDTEPSDIREYLFKTIKVGATTGSNTLTLPDLTDLPNDAWFWLVNTGHSGGFAVTVQCQSAQFVSSAADEISTNSSSFAMTSGRAYLFVKISSGSIWQIALKTWFVTPDETADETERTLVYSGGTVTFDGALGTLGFINTANDFSVEVAGMKQGITFTLNKTGTGRLNGITVKTGEGWTLTSKKFGSNDTSINTFADTPQTSDDMILLTRFGSRIQYDIIPLRSTPT